MSFGRKFSGAAAAAALVWMAGAAAQPDELRARLSVVPIDPTTQATTTGEGTVRARLQGRRLVIDGGFEGLSGPATAARLYLSPAIGVRGPPIHDIEVTHATAGTVEAALELSAREADALRSGRLYVQIDSEAAPEGNLWGWLLQ